METQTERIKRLELDYLEESFRFQEEARDKGLVLADDGRIHNPNSKNPVEITIWVLLPVVTLVFVYLVMKVF